VPGVTGCRARAPRRSTGGAIAQRQRCVSPDVAGYSVRATRTATVAQIDRAVCEEEIFRAQARALQALRARRTAPRPRPPRRRRRPRPFGDRATRRRRRRGRRGPRRTCGRRRRRGPGWSWLPRPLLHLAPNPRAKRPWKRPRTRPRLRKWPRPRKRPKQRFLAPRLRGYARRRSGSRRRSGARRRRRSGSDARKSAAGA